MAVNRQLVRGLGLYPDEPCYDPARPSWLPYWLSSYTEEDCVIAKFFGKYPGVTYNPDLYPSPPAPVAPSTPPAEVVVGGNVTPEEAQAIQDKLIADSNAATKSSLSKFFSDLAAKIDERTKGCSWYQVEGAGGQCVVGGARLWIVGGAAVALALYLKGRN